MTLLSGLLHKAPTCCPKRKLGRSYLTRSSTRWHLPRIATSLQIRWLQFIRNIFGIEKQEWDCFPTTSLENNTCQTSKGRPATTFIDHTCWTTRLESNTGLTRQDLVSIKLIVSKPHSIVHTLRSLQAYLSPPSLAQNESEKLALQHHELFHQIW